MKDKILLDPNGSDTQPVSSFGSEDFELFRLRPCGGGLTSLIFKLGFLDILGLILSVGNENSSGEAMGAAEIQLVFIILADLESTKMLEF